MATITVDQQKLVMNTFAAHLQNQLVSSEIATWKKFDGEMNARNGYSVSEQVGPRYDVTETTNGVKDLSSGVQDSVFGSEQFTVNKTFGTSMGWGDFVKVQDIDSARESEAIAGAASSLAHKIDSYVMGVIATASNNWTGDATNGDPISEFLDVVNGYTRIKEEGVEDTDIKAILSFYDKARLGDNVIDIPSTDGLSTSTYRNQFSGAVGGIPTLFTQQLPVLTAGTRVATGSVSVDGASQNVDYSDVAVSSSPGFYKTQTINLTVPNTKTVVAGDVFEIAGVYAYDNRKGAAVSPARLQQFTVVTGATGDASNNATVRIYPAIIVPGTGSGGDISVNNAHATVSAVPADTAAVSFIGAASASLSPRLLVQKPAIIINTMNLPTPDTGKMLSKGLTKIPLSVRMWKHSDFDTGEHKVRFDVALTANVRDRARIVRINGSAA